MELHSIYDYDTALRELKKELNRRLAQQYYRMAFYYAVPGLLLFSMACSVIKPGMSFFAHYTEHWVAGLFTLITVCLSAIFCACEVRKGVKVARGRGL